jgi:protein TonB
MFNGSVAAKPSFDGSDQSSGKTKKARPPMAPRGTGRRAQLAMEAPGPALHRTGDVRRRRAFQAKRPGGGFDVAARKQPPRRGFIRVGTAPDGEPLYAAQWYEEPGEDMMRSYLSTARGPGWGLIACRTAPDYRVEDCVPLSEYPEGSQINRAILAAAWEFRVRPPRRGG